MTRKNTSIPVVADEGNDSLFCQRVAMHIWNGTQWVAFTGLNVKADNLTVSMADVEKLLSKYYWESERYDFSGFTGTGTEYVYVGRSTTRNASPSSGNLWTVWRLVFDNGLPIGPNLRKESINWDDRGNAGNWS